MRTYLPLGDWCPRKRTRSAAAPGDSCFQESTLIGWLYGLEEFDAWATTHSPHSFYDEQPVNCHVMALTSANRVDISSSATPASPPALLFGCVLRSMRRHVRKCFEPVDERFCYYYYFFNLSSSHTLYRWIEQCCGDETSTLCRPEVPASPCVWVHHISASFFWWNFPWNSLPHNTPTHQNVKHCEKLSCIIGNPLDLPRAPHKTLFHVSLSSALDLSETYRYDSIHTDLQMSLSTHLQVFLRFSSTPTWYWRKL